MYKIKRGVQNMKNIKHFKYKDAYSFDRFLSAYGYSLDDVKGFSFAEKRQHNGNILKIYNIHFNDGEYEYFKVVYFKDFNEYKQTFLGFNGEKLLMWYNDANIIWYKFAGKVFRVKYH